MRFNLFQLNNPYYAKSYSQEGEDMVLRSLFFRQKEGFYVDVGAHHPQWYSNTKHFYDEGWRGINIDARPGTKELFDLERERDVNLELGIGQEAKSTFYIYDDGAFNTFNLDLVQSRLKESNHGPIDEIQVDIEPLSSILSKYLPQNTAIDFISIDVEGKDLEVLKSNDWNLFRPRFVMVEAYSKDLADISTDKTYEYLRNKGYALVASTKNTLIFNAL